VLRKLLAEFLGTALLLATVVGSGIMGVALANGNDAIALLANAAATAGILYVVISVLGPISGAHFNPAVTLAMRIRREMDTALAVAYVLVQLLAAVSGVIIAHAMFDLPLVQAGIHARSGFPQWIGEGVATFGLTLTIILGMQLRASAVPGLVASYIFAAYWFTSSTSFANPAVTVARALTATFAGIRPTDVLGFVSAQLLGMLVGVAAGAVLRPRSVSGRSGGRTSA
jgi:glycerol uptake facilitator-like aquaporin